MSNTEEWTAKNIHEKLLEDIIKEGKVFEVLDKDTSKWVLKDLQNDGRCNFIFLLTDAKDKTILIKWTSPFVRSIPGFSLDQKRGEFERDYLILNSTLYPNSTPHVYFFSNTHYYFGMEYLEGFSNFKNALIKGEKNDNFAPKLGEYLALKSFKTSNFHLKPQEMVKNTLKFIQNTNMRSLIDHFNFQFFGGKTDTSKFSEKIKNQLESIQNTEEIKLKVKGLQVEMRENVQCVLHGDFHTGSVLMKDDQIYIIDAEATTVGPIAYDIGILFGNVVFGYLFQIPFETSKDERKDLRTWILKALDDTWNIFVSKFSELWQESNQEFKKNYFKKILDSTIGFMGIILLRGAIEDWPEYSHLKNVERERVSLYILSVVKSLLSKQYESMKDVCLDIEKAEF